MIEIMALKDALDRLYSRYNHEKFIDPDPLVFLHRYDNTRDREVAGFIASALAFGGVRQIMGSVGTVLERMGGSPADYILGNDRKEFYRDFSDFRHRWASVGQLSSILSGMRRVLRDFGSLEAAFDAGYGSEDEDTIPALTFLVSHLDSPGSCGNNCLLPSPARGSACKRLNLFLKWMVRKDRVDPGGWTCVPPSKLIIPLDVHIYRIASLLGMTGRKQADLKTAREVTAQLRMIDDSDPAKYDFGLTRLGIRRDFDRNELVGKLGLTIDSRGRLVT